jgi:hypothetical protein
MLQKFNFINPKSIIIAHRAASELTCFQNLKKYWYMKKPIENEEYKYYCDKIKTNSSEKCLLCGKLPPKILKLMFLILKLYLLIQFLLLNIFLMIY